MCTLCSDVDGVGITRGLCNLAFVVPGFWYGNVPSSSYTLMPVPILVVGEFSCA